MSECEDCGDDMERQRRRRCSACGLLLCAWCWAHEHALARSTLKHQSECNNPHCARCQEGIP